MEANSNLPRSLGIYLTVFMAVLIFFLLYLWPPESQQVEDPNAPNAQSAVSDTDANSAANNSSIQKEKMEAKCPVSGAKFIALVLITGALGACLHAITSLAFHCSRKKFSDEWLWWYIYRPFVGGILALIFYLIINSRLVSTGAKQEDMFYVILGISGMVGLFSNQALEWLSRIFNAIFTIVKPPDKEDKNPEDENPGNEDDDSGEPPADDTKKKQPKRTPPKKNDQ